MTTLKTAVASGPLNDVHRDAGATLMIIDGWEIATRYPAEPKTGGHALVDLSHLSTYEINSPETGALLKSIFGADVPLRTIQQHEGSRIYRLTDRRAILFNASDSSLKQRAIDVTGGWASIALIGLNAHDILSKITAVDLRLETLPVNTCCQGPLFGVNTLFGRFENRFELHICTDSAEFFWEVLLDAGQEYGLKPAGLEFYDVATKTGVSA